MNFVSTTSLVLFLVLAAHVEVFAQPPKGSQLPPGEIVCITCHGDPDQWEGDQKKGFIDPKVLERDVHWKKGVNCQDCHGGNAGGEDKDGAHEGRRPLAEMRKVCANCHKDESVELFKSVHTKAGPKNERGEGTQLDCSGCHGNAAHEILPATDHASPVYLDNQVKTCGHCHEKDLGTYTKNVHGFGLYKSGLSITAVCSSCHGSHGVYRKQDNRSTLSPTNVATTCGNCHRFIPERLQKSVHGRDVGNGHGIGALANRNAPGGTINRRPTCTDCHLGHETAFPESAAFRMGLPNFCGNCHVDLSGTYRLSIHGELTQLGYVPAAGCPDCHGGHEILPINDANSHLSPQNRQATCAKCHPNANRNFSRFDPHADYTSAQTNPVLHATYLFLLTLLIGTFSFFGLHSVLWFIRELIDVMKHGRPVGLIPGRTAYVRFVQYHQRAHTVLLLAFLGLAMTGMPLKYHDTTWAQAVIRYLGGFESTSFLHRICALVTFGCLFAYMVRLVQQYFAARRGGKSRTAAIFSPDSPIPNRRDFKDFFQMVRWFVGLGPKPTYERWAYWEKFDFWGACADIIIIGSTGLILWFPNFFCTVLPGGVLNFAKVIHSTQALLATGFVFAIHFYHAFLRPEKFPADMSVLTGLVSEEEFLHERPEFFERLRREGELDKRRTTVPEKRHLWFDKAEGYFALAVGLFLLIAMIVASLGR
jgi:cytochrome b subunit of formate dehydrogenase